MARSPSRRGWEALPPSVRRSPTGHHHRRHQHRVAGARLRLDAEPRSMPAAEWSAPSSLLPSQPTYSSVRTISQRLGPKLTQRSWSMRPWESAPLASLLTDARIPRIAWTRGRIARFAEDRVNLAKRSALDRILPLKDVIWRKVLGSDRCPAVVAGRIGLDRFDRLFRPSDGHGARDFRPAAMAQASAPYQPDRAQLIVYQVFTHCRRS